MHLNPKIVAALLVTSCGGQRGKTDTVDKVYPDTEPPVFIFEPAVENIATSGADILFAVNESSESFLVVRKDIQLSLTNAEVESADDKKSVTVKAFETVRIPLSDLEADREYRFFLTVRDTAGNVIGEPVIREFKTTKALVVSTLSGMPNPARQAVPWRFTPDGLQPECSLTISNGPTWMKVSENGAAVEGIPSWQVGKTDESFRLETVGEFCSGFGEFKVKTQGDPLFDFAWHMNPESKGAFSWFSAKQSRGINLAAASTRGLTGAGINVTIVDSGMQIDHPDLKNRINLEANINLELLLPVSCQVCDSKDTSPPLSPGESGDQGTAVAGIIAAEGWNGIGSRGIATGVKISAYNLTARRFPEVSENDHLRVLSLTSDIVCHSGVASDKILTEMPRFDFDSYDRAQKSKVNVGRDGKGTIYVKAAGDMDVLRGNAAFDQRNVTSWGMIVGSHNALTLKSRGSNQGSNLWISAPGGEAGFQSDFNEVTIAKNVLDYYPGIVSADIFNREFPCSVGYAKNPRYYQSGLDPDPAVHNVGISSGFNLGWHDLNKDCQYTATVASTPAATAMVAAAAALLLEANPTLTWRDVKHILAKSAEPIDSDRASEITNIRGSMYERTLPWITNAAGFRFHNAYGFGALDIGKALEVALSASFRTLPVQTDSNWILAASPVQRIPPASIAGVFSDYYHLQDVLIESLQVRVNASHPAAGNLGIELVSPNGTRSILKAVKDGARFSNLDDVIFLSNAFYGERARGIWQLRVVDGKETPQAGYLNSWYFRVTGHHPDGDSKEIRYER